jgi:hypothetical protein
METSSTLGSGHHQATKKELEHKKELKIVSWESLYFKLKYIKIYVRAHKDTTNL